MTITVNLTNVPVGVTVSANAGSVSVSAATVTPVQVAIGNALPAHGHNATDVFVSDIGATYFAVDTELNGVLSSIDTALGVSWSTIAGKAAAAHTHSAADITSGTLSDSRLSVNAKAAVESFIHPFLLGGL